MDWTDPFAVLRTKWSEVPAGDARLNTKQLLKIGDQDLLRLWTEARRRATTGDNFSVRGWYHTLYGSALRGKRVLDVGSGLGIDAITFAECDAKITFLDVVESNLAVCARICELLNLKNVDFCYLKDLSSLSDLAWSYDVIWCQGSLIHLPFQHARSEAQELLKHLKPSGRWIELAYPRTRWEPVGKEKADSHSTSGAHGLTEEHHGLSGTTWTNCSHACILQDSISCSTLNSTTVISTGSILSGAIARFRRLDLINTRAKSSVFGAVGGPRHHKRADYKVRISLFRGMG